LGTCVRVGPVEVADIGKRAGALDFGEGGGVHAPRGARGGMAPGRGANVGELLEASPRKRPRAHRAVGQDFERIFPHETPHRLAHRHRTRAEHRRRPVRRQRLARRKTALAYPIAQFLIDAPMQRLVRRTRRRRVGRVGLGSFAERGQFQYNRRLGNLRSQSKTAQIKNVPELLAFYFDPVTTLRFVITKCRARHGAAAQAPDQEGLDGSKQTDSTGKYFVVEMHKVAAENGEGFVAYRGSKPNAPLNRTLPKLSFVKLFAPWKWSLGTTVFTDDIGAVIWQRIYVSSAVALGFLAAIGGLAGAVALRPSRRLDVLRAAMTSLAAGDSNVALPQSRLSTKSVK